MLKRQLWTIALMGSALTTLPAFGQTEYKQDVTAQVTGNYSRATTENGARLDTTDSAGFLGTYRYFFGRNHGIEGNYGYTRNTQQVQFAGAQGGIQTNTHEVSAAYVLRLPTKRVTPFALAGIGALIYDRTNSQADLVAKPSFVYGGGADFHLTDRFFLRAQYRGQVFNSPRLGIAPERFTHPAQPSVGFGVRF
ncbi:MAG: outer membrane beta-barrel protein [Bryobacteraceae bacterium]